MKLSRPLAAVWPAPIATLLGSLCNLFDGVSAVWLVGGTLRDLLCHQQPHDYDLTFAEDQTPQIRRWARSVGGSWFWLDSTRNQSRIVFKTPQIQFDFSPLRAATIEADLSLRDFTINAMAVPLRAWNLASVTVIDPVGGYQDLLQGCLRRCGALVLEHDPLRILKGIRHQAQHGWQIESQTRKQMRQLVPLLEQVAAERIRSELGRIFSAPQLITALPLLEHTGLLKQLLGIETTKASFADLMQPLVAARQRLDRHPSLSMLLNDEIEDGLSRAGLLLLAQLLNLAGLKNPRIHLKKLRFSTKTCALVEHLNSAPDPLSSLLVATSARVAALKVQNLEPFAVEQLLAALLQQPDEQMDQIVACRIENYGQFLHKQQIDPLLSGQQIMQITGLPPGEAVGVWQKKIKLAEIAGEIADQSTATKWLQAKFSN